MGSEDLFHKRKAKATSDLDRKKARRASYDKVLIVCEGEKTEPNYFNELVNFYKISSANVAIDGTCGSSPKSVLDKAIELYENEKSKGDGYDRVYCVFDRDSHETYESTVRNISAIQPKNTFLHCTSVPCFEYWLILHFMYSTKPYVASGNKSSGANALKDLKNLMPDYEKGLKGVFGKLHDQIEFAKENSKRAYKQSVTNHTDNPSTLIHELVDYLQNIQN